jgi:hypothetical protein
MKLLATFLSVAALLVAVSVAYAQISDPDAQSVTKRTALSFSGKMRGLKLSGYPFGAQPSGSAFSPSRLTLWLPKNVTFRPWKPCTEGTARKLTLDSSDCSQLIGGRVLSAGSELRAWFAWAGPKRGSNRTVWLRARTGEDLVGFGRGKLIPASGAYGSKLVLNLGALDVRTRFLELASDGVATGDDCPRGGWRYKVAVTSPQGNASFSGRSKCGGPAPPPSKPTMTNR